MMLFLAAYGAEHPECDSLNHFSTSSQTVTHPDDNVLLTHTQLGWAAAVGGHLQAHTTQIYSIKFH